MSTHIPTPTAGVAGDALDLETLAEHVTGAFPAARTEIARGELTVYVQPDILLDVLRFAREDEQLSCELLSDLAGVHWPAGEHVIERQQSTSGWPEYRVSRERGVVEVAYVLRSVTRNHWLRVSCATDDTEPRLPSATGLYPTADFHEREVFDMFGVDFTDHPNLERILMPEDWLGHPHRKDYPLGGVEIPYKNDKYIPPPHERDLREVVE